MTPTTLLDSRDMFVLFDGCPTCNWKDARYLMDCRVYADQMHRVLRVVPSGSATATAIRAIAKEQGAEVRYPMILLDGLIYYSPQDISLDDYLVDDDNENERSF